MQSVKLNLIPGAVLPVVNVSQYDVKRTFQLAVYDGAASYDLTGKTVTIRGTKPDNHGFDYGTSDGVVSVSGNTVTISTTQQMTAVGGQVMAELRIESGTTVIGTLNFIIDVDPSALSDETIISDTEIPVIERDFEAALAEAEADALVAEGYAKGTQDGTPVGSGSPYYHDNAKYYKEQAEEAASGVLEKYPKIVSDYWYIWDVETNQYVNTGVRAKGTQGDPGEGVPAGGTTGQVLRKKSDTDYDTEWANGGGGASALDDLTDVDITSPASGQGLLYDGAEWVNGAVAAPAQLAAKLDVTAQQQLGAWNLQPKTARSSTTINTIPFVINADGSIAFSGTNSSVDALHFHLYTANYSQISMDGLAIKPGGTYWFHGLGSGGVASDNSYSIAYAFYNSGGTRLGVFSAYDDDVQYTVPATAALMRCTIDVAGSYTVPAGTVYYPMVALQPGMPYVPPVMTNKELTDYTTIEDITSEFSYASGITARTDWTRMIRCGKLISVQMRFTTPSTVTDGIAVMSVPVKYAPKIAKQNNNAMVCGGLMGSSNWNGAIVGVLAWYNNNFILMSTGWQTSKEGVIQFNYLID